jgi:1-deoxy-D-xylulose-5-phosphate reductoisomerase
MKHLTILGSTGSIGSNTLKVVEMFPERFTVKAMTAKKNIRLIAKQIEQFNPELAVVYDEKGAQDLKDRLPTGTKVDIMYGAEGYIAAATQPSVDMVVAAMVGAAGLMPTLAAIDEGIDIALANKETLVMAGDIVMKRADERGVQILPIDSEHSAIFQCISGSRKADLKKIILTASGGPLIHRPKNEFNKIKPKDALKHPTWQMGEKISIDSATLMNKGLEILEAKHFFGVSQDRIEVLIHPQSIVHSMVAYHDGAVIAQLGIPDMRGAIAYALSWPERLPLDQPLPDFQNIGALTFERPDLNRFPCLQMAFDVCKIGGTLPVVLNAANEVAVQTFLNQTISFDKIPEIIRNTIDQHVNVSNPSLSDILETDRWARKQAEKKITEMTNSLLTG